MTSGFMRLTALRFKRKQSLMINQRKSALEWDNHIQNVHLGKYIVRCTMGNHGLQLCLCVTLTPNFLGYSQGYTSPNEDFEYSYLLNPLYTNGFFLLV